MKTIKTIAFAGVIGLAALTATSAQAFWGWNNGNGNGWNNGNGWGNGWGNGDGAFDFSMSARGNGYNGYNGYNGWNGYNGYAPYGYAPYGYAPYAYAAPQVDKDGKVVAPAAPQFAAPAQVPAPVYAPYPYGPFGPQAFAAPGAPAPANTQK